MNRRRLLRRAGVAGLALLAGCTSNPRPSGRPVGDSGLDDGDDGDDEPDGPAGTTDPRDIFTFAEFEMEETEEGRLRLAGVVENKTDGRASGTLTFIVDYVDPATRTPGSETTGTGSETTTAVPETPHEVVLRQSAAFDLEPDGTESFAFVYDVQYETWAQNDGGFRRTWTNVRTGT